MLKFIKQYYTNLITILLFGGSSVYSFIKGNNIIGTICLLFLFITYLMMEIQALNKRVGELSLELCDLDKKIAKVKLGIKD